MSDYNGWTNRATWLIVCWFNPETKEDVRLSRQALEEAISDLTEKHNLFWLADFVDTDINWDELMEHFEEEENE